MKKMMKIMTALAVALTALGAFAQAPYVTEADTDITASKTVYTNFVNLGSDSYKEVVKLTFLNSTAVTATTVTATEDVGVWTTISTVSVTTGSTAVTYPVRTYTTSGGFINGTNVISATSVPYIAKKLRLITTLSGTNGVALADGFKYSVYAK